MILIYGIIMTLIVVGITSKNNLEVDLSAQKLIPIKIANNFYTVDTNFNDLLSYCSFYELQLKDFNNTTFENCTKIPSVLKSFNLTIDNNTSSIYNICYNYNYNKFSSNSENLSKILSKKNNNPKTVCVKKHYNNFYNSTILNEVINFFNGNNTLNKINLVYNTWDPNTNTTVRVSTFNYNGMTYNKKNYYLNGVSLFDNEISGDSVYFSNLSKEILYKYYPSNRKLEIFSHYSITTNKKIIENLRKINSNKYNIIDSNVTDGNLEILKK